MPNAFTLIWLLPYAHLLMAFCAVAHVLLHSRDSRGAFGWIALCIILPLAGSIIYLIFGVNRVNTRAKQRYSTRLSKDASDALTEPAGTMFRPLSNIGERLTGKGLSSCDEVIPLENGEELFPSMLDAINGAQEYILLCTYIFDHDTTGTQFVRALSSAVDRGVEAKVIVDGMGGLISAGRIRVALRKAGVEFETFNPVTLIPPALNINMRSHRKMLIIDGQYAFTGGSNIGDRHLCQNPQPKHCARDIHFRLQGRIVDELEWAFRRDWQYCKGQQQNAPYCNKNKTNPEAALWSRLVLDGPNKDLDRLNDLITGVIGAASHRVWIITPYFLPTLDLIGALISAHLRDVDVRILLPENNNIKLAHWASRNVLRPILEKQIPVFYQSGPFAHAKVMIIDDQYSLIGSANLDPRSLRLNYELGVEMFSGELNAKLRTYFTNSERNSRQVTIHELENRSLLTRLRDSLAWLFSPYL